jgi:hypothetical protein
MKNLILILVFVTVCIFRLNAQYLEPVDLIIQSDSLQVGLVPGVSLDNKSGAVLSSTIETGLVVGLKSVTRGRKCVSSQFLVNINPLIVGWNSFKLDYPFKKISVDTFNYEKIPFDEESVMHFGYKWIIKTRDRRIKDLFLFVSPYVNTEINPYNIMMDSSNLRFNVIKANIGCQVGQLKVGLKWVNNFLWGGSFQVNYMGVNETDQYLNSFKVALGNNYRGKNYYGISGKVTVQYKYVNAYFEIKQYWALDNGYKNNNFTKNPILMFGVCPNIPYKASYLPKAKKKVVMM